MPDQRTAGAATQGIKSTATKETCDISFNLTLLFWLESQFHRVLCAQVAVLHLKLILMYLCSSLLTRV